MKLEVPSIALSLIHNQPVALTGQFTNTGTATNTFCLQSTPILFTIDGQVVTKTYHFDGVVVDKGNIISGTYREAATNSQGYHSAVYSGHFFRSRPARYSGAVTSTVSVTSSGGDLLVSWADDAANCGYQLYRSATQPHRASSSMRPRSIGAPTPTPIQVPWGRIASTPCGACRAAAISIP